MADSALVTGLIGLGGVALGLLGNPSIEWVKRTASRRDAAAERQAAILRELQDVVGEYSRQWGEIISAIERSELHPAELRELPLTSDASIAGQRFRSLIERVTDEALRQDLTRYSAEVFDRAVGAEGSLPTPDLWGRMNQVQSHIGRVLRRLS